MEVTDHIEQEISKQSIQRTEQQSRDQSMLEKLIALRTSVMSQDPLWLQESMLCEQIDYEYRNKHGLNFASNIPLGVLPTHTVTKVGRRSEVLEYTLEYPHVAMTMEDTIEVHEIEEKVLSMKSPVFNSVSHLHYEVVKVKTVKCASVDLMYSSMKTMVPQSIVQPIHYDESPKRVQKHDQRLREVEHCVAMKINCFKMLNAVSYSHPDLHYIVCAAKPQTQNMDEYRMTDPRYENWISIGMMEQKSPLEVYNILHILKNRTLLVFYPERMKNGITNVELIALLTLNVVEIGEVAGTEKMVSPIRYVFAKGLIENNEGSRDTLVSTPKAIRTIKIILVATYQKRIQARINPADASEYGVIDSFNLQRSSPLLSQIDRNLKQEECGRYRVSVVGYLNERATHHYMIIVEVELSEPSLAFREVMRDAGIIVPSFDLVVSSQFLMRRGTASRKVVKYIYSNYLRMQPSRVRQYGKPKNAREEATQMFLRSVDHHKLIKRKEFSFSYRLHVFDALNVGDTISLPNSLGDVHFLKKERLYFCGRLYAKYVPMDNDLGLVVDVIKSLQEYKPRIRFSEGYMMENDLNLYTVGNEGKELQSILEGHNFTLNKLKFLMDTIASETRRKQDAEIVIDKDNYVHSVSLDTGMGRAISVVMRLKNKVIRIGIVPREQYDIMNYGKRKRKE